MTKSTANVLRRPLRIAIAIFFFVASTTLGIGLVTGKKTSSRPNRPRVTEQAVPDGDGGGFFYESLGRAPTQTPGGADEETVRIAHAAGFTLEFHAPTQQKAAEELVDALKTRGIAAYYTPLSDNGRIIYRVRQGIYPTEAKALDDAKQLAKVLGQEPRVVRLE